MTTPPPGSLSRGRMFALVLILAGLTGLGPVAMDVYLPAFPEIARHFGATQGQVQLTLTLNVIGLVVGQLVLSPLTDQRGRRGILLGSLALTLATSLAAAWAPSIGFLTVDRLLQGIGSGACIAIARAIGADVAKGAAAARLFSLFITLSAVGPIVAPVLGAQLLMWTGSWRSMFILMGVVAAVLLVAVALLVPETLAPADRHTGGLRDIGITFTRLIGDRVFLGYALTVIFAYSAMFAYLAAGSFVLEEQFGLSARGYAIVFAVNSVGLLSLGFLNARLVRTRAPRRLLIAALAAATLAAGVLAIAVLGTGWGLAAILPMLFIVVATRGMITPNAMVLGVQRSSATGAASAILGAFMFAGGIIVTPFVGLTPDRPSVAMAIAIAAGTLLALASTVVLTRHSGARTSGARKATGGDDAAHPGATPMDR